MNHNLDVKFYRRPWQNFYLSTLEGRPIFEDRDFVKILIPGNSLTVIDTLAEPYHTETYKVEWAQYQNALSGEVSHTGTPLTAWNQVTPAIAENLKYFKFFTVEQVAGASDVQLQAIEHCVGMSAFAFRDQAKYFLASSKEQADKAKQMAENEALRQMAADMQSAMQVMQAELMALKRASNDDDKPKRVRRTKEQIAADMRDKLSEEQAES